jgi:hypothetical protein
MRQVITRLPRSIAVALTAAAIVGSLSGCERVFVGPLAVKRDGQQLLIAVCTDVVSTRLLAESRNVEANKPWVRFVDVSETFAFSSGQIVSTGTGGDVSVSQSVQPDLSSGSDIVVTLQAKKSTGFGAAFEIRGGALSETKWLHPNGDLTTLPCPAK